jgi:hypothetical protein
MQPVVTNGCTYVNIIQPGLQVGCWRLQQFNVFNSCNRTSGGHQTVTVYVLTMYVFIMQPIAQTLLNKHGCTTGCLM